MFHHKNRNHTQVYKPPENKSVHLIKLHQVDLLAICLNIMSNGCCFLFYIFCTHSKSWMVLFWLLQPTLLEMLTETQNSKSKAFLSVYMYFKLHNSWSIRWSANSSPRHAFISPPTRWPWCDLCDDNTNKNKKNGHIQSHSGTHTGTKRYS